MKIYSNFLFFVTPWTYSPPGSSVHGILQARIPEWVAMSSSRRSSQTQGSNPSLPHCRQILYPLSNQGSPRILEWVASPFRRGSSRPWNQSRVSCIAGGFFTSWATREALNIQFGENMQILRNLKTVYIETFKSSTVYKVCENLNHQIIISYFAKFKSKNTFMDYIRI